MNITLLAYLNGMLSVTDPGFPRGMGANRKGGDTNLLFCPILPKNLHENENN